MLKEYHRVEISKPMLSRVLGWLERFKYIKKRIVVERGNNKIKAKYLTIRLLEGYFKWLGYVKSFANDPQQAFNNQCLANEFTSISHQHTPNRQEPDRQILNTEEKSGDNKEKSCSEIATFDAEEDRKKVEALNNKIRVRDFISRFSSAYTNGYSTNEEYLRSVVDNYLNPPDGKWIYFYIKKYKESWIPFFNIFISPLEPLRNKYSDEVIQRIANRLPVTQPLKEKEINLMPYKDMDFNTTVVKGLETEIMEKWVQYKHKAKTMLKTIH